MNLLIISGNLGKDPELKHTQNGKAVCKLSVATTEKRKTANGMQEITEWHNVIIWDKQAENCDKYLSKGSKVLVQGKVQTRNYENKEGLKVYVTEVIAFSVEFLSPPKEQKQEAVASKQDDLDSIPF